MNDKICPICKYYGRINWGNHKDTIYENGREIPIYLCYHHSVDLFKNGQFNFKAKYREIFSGYDLLEVQTAFTSPKGPSLFRF